METETGTVVETGRFVCGNPHMFFCCPNIGVALCLKLLELEPKQTPEGRKQTPPPRKTTVKDTPRLDISNREQL